MTGLSGATEPPDAGDHQATATALGLTVVETSVDKTDWFEVTPVSIAALRIDPPQVSDEFSIEVTDAAGEVIHNFVSHIDKINFQPLESNRPDPANPHLVFAGGTATRNAVWAVAQGSDMLISVDLSGDALADMEFLLIGVATVVARDFLL